MEKEKVKGGLEGKWDVGLTLTKTYKHTYWQLHVCTLLSYISTSPGFPFDILLTRILSYSNFISCTCTFT